MPGTLSARRPANRYILRAGEVAKRERQRRGSVRAK